MEYQNYYTITIKHENNILSKILITNYSGWMDSQCFCRIKQINIYSVDIIYLLLCVLPNFSWQPTEMGTDLRTIYVRNHEVLWNYMKICKAMYVSEIKCLRDLRLSQRCVNWSRFVLKLQLHTYFGCETKFPTTTLKWHSKIKWQVWYKRGLTWSFTNFEKQQKTYLKMPQAGKLSGPQVVVFIKDSYKHQLVV